MATRHVEWLKAWRIIATRFPPIDLYERLTSDPAIWDALIALEQLTNPRIRQDVGDISLVKPEDRVSGPGASYVMACFTHLNPKGSRFSDGTYGVYYCASTLETAIAETIYHFEKFARAARDPVRMEAMRVLVGSVTDSFEDVAALPDVTRADILNPESYAASVPFGKTIRSAGGNGIVYPSVRHPAGECLAALRPKVVSIPIQERHLQYRWNGQRVDRYFDHSIGEWANHQNG
jgi:hypothetical protein